MFSGRYIILKLIECENKEPEDSEHEGTNIDLNYIAIDGQTVNIK